MTLGSDSHRRTWQNLIETEREAGYRRTVPKAVE